MKKFIYLLLGLLLFAFSTSLFILDVDKPIFFCAIILMVLIVFKAKVSAFSVVTVFMTYILLPVFWQSIFGESYGILRLAPHLYSKEIYYSIFLFNFAIYLMCYFTRILINEKKMYQVNVPYNRIFCYICACIAVTFSIISFPSFVGERFDALLPGNAWNHLVLVSLLFLAFYMKESHIAKVAFIFSLGWFLLHGERVDMLGYMIFLFIFIFHRYKIKITPKSFLLLATGGVSMFLLLILVGARRTGDSFNLIGLVRTLIVQPTACDIAYVFNSSIHFSKTEVLYKGFTYIDNLKGLIPFVPTPNRPEILLNVFYGAPGGEFYLSESIMNYGYLFGVIVSITMFVALSYTLLKYHKRSLYIACATMFIICALPRIIWYGKHYVYTGLLYFIPAIFILKSLTKKAEGVLYDEK